jgi:hypothetical protein
MVLTYIQKAVDLLNQKEWKRPYKHSIY